MIWMNIITVDSEIGNKIINKEIKKGDMIHEGIKILGAWFDMKGNRIFILVESEDGSGLALKENLNLNDLIKIEIVPVMAMEDVMKMLLGSLKEV